MPPPSPRGSQREEFQLRWHSIVDPTTPSADIMSSPDPLAEPTLTLLGTELGSSPPTRRRSRTPARRPLSSFLGSPRKRTFELQVGDRQSPRKLLVTVEAEGAAEAETTPAPSRTLFRSPAATPAARRRPRVATATTTTTTTTVPLRESIEDEPGPRRKTATTPKRRGRIRQSNGTPRPRASTANPAPTPTPPRRRASSRKKKASDDGSPPSPSRSRSAPRSSRRKSQVRSVASEPPSDSHDPPAPPKVSAVKRTRRRRQALAPEELVELADEAVADLPPHDPEPAPLPPPSSDDEMDLLMAPSYLAADPAPALHPPISDNPESDIWMATLSNRATSPTHSPSQPFSVASLASPTGEAAEAPADRQPYSVLETQLADAFTDPAPDPSESHFAHWPIDSPASPAANDTIAQGEDFSMIYMDSIPSLQAALNDSNRDLIAVEELGEETNLIINNTLESLRQEAAQAGDAGGAATAPSEPQQPGPSSTEPRQSQERPSPNQQPAFPSSFSGSVSSPRRPRSPRKAAGSSPLRHRVLRHAAMKRDDPQGRRAALTDREEASMSQLQADSRFSSDDNSSIPYEDSFSEIPQEVLAAATPRKPDKPPGAAEEVMEMDGDSEEMQAETHQPAEEGHADEALLEASARPERGRLPTPDESPPRVEPEEMESELHVPSAEVKKTPASVPLPNLEAASKENSSGEQPAFDVREDAEAAAVADGSSTPSSGPAPGRRPSTPSQGHQSPRAGVARDTTSRPALSAIVRAGRVLQSITSDPPSPDGGDKQLRSPFRGSSSRDSLSGSRGSQHSRQSSHSSDQRRGHFQSPGEEAPAGANPRPAVPSREAELAGRGAGEGDDRWHSVKASVTSSSRFSPGSTDAMSWIAEAGPLSPRLRGEALAPRSAPSSSIRAVLGSITPRQFDGPADDEAEEDQDGDEVDDGDDDDDDEVDDGKDGEEEETDLWEFEAQRETPRATRQQPFGKRMPASSRRRRGIPSPWPTRSSAPSPAKAGTAMDDHDEEAFTAPDTAAEPAQADQGDEYSLLAQQPEKPADPAAKASRFELSSFFSSPAAIPGLLAQKLFPSKSPALPADATSVPLEAASRPAPAEALPASSMFPQPPPSKARGEVDAPASVVETDPRPAAPPSQPSARERRPLFAAQPRRVSRTFFQPSPQRPAAVTPPRMQLSHADIHKWQQETSNASDESSDFSRPFLRPLPPKNASPTKSSLRSPLKPRTPGRVVAFTSSVTSPVEQAEARQKLRFPGSWLMPLLQGGPPAPAASPTPAPQQEDKENEETGDVFMDEAPPLDKQPGPAPDPKPDAGPQAEPASGGESLSQTQWTRQHWVLLDRLLQLRRRGPLEKEYERRADELLGRTIRSGGEAMTVERWHLDCVDAFMAEVGGWDDEALAKRVFGLIAAARRRKKLARLRRRGARQGEAPSTTGRGTALF